MSLTANPIVPGDGGLVISDGAGTPLTFSVPYEEGNLNLGEIMHLQKEMLLFYARDAIYAAREGKTLPLELTFTADLPGLTDSTTKCLLDAVRRTGTFSAATGTLPASAGGLGTSGTRGIYTLQCAWTWERSDFGATADAALTLKYCRLSASIQEGNPSKLTMKITAIPYSTDWITVA